MICSSLSRPVCSGVLSITRLGSHLCPHTHHLVPCFAPFPCPAGSSPPGIRMVGRESCFSLSPQWPLHRGPSASALSSTPAVYLGVPTLRTSRPDTFAAPCDPPLRPRTHCTHTGYVFFLRSSCQLRFKAFHWIHFYPIVSVLAQRLAWKMVSASEHMKRTFKFCSS